MLSKIGGEVLHVPRLVISASELLLICIYISNSLFIHYELSYYEPRYHCEHCFKYVQEGVNECYSAIYAIKKFKIVVYDCSHLLSSKHLGSNIPFHKCQKHFLTVQKNCVLIFHGGLIHCGAPFGHNEGKCHRLFLYLVPDGVHHERKTYKIVEVCSVCDVCTGVERDALLASDYVYDGAYL